MLLVRGAQQTPGQDVKSVFSPGDILLLAESGCSVCIIIGHHGPFSFCTSGSRRAAANQGSRSGGDHGTEETLWLVGSGHC